MTTEQTEWVPEFYFQKPPSGPRVRKRLEYDERNLPIFNADWHYRHNLSFTVGEIAYIVQMYAKGEMKQVALDLGRMPNSVYSIVRKVRRLKEWRSYQHVDTSNFLERLAKEEAAFLRRRGFSELADEPEIFS